MPADCSPPSRSAIAWQVVPSDSPAVRGRVVNIDSLTPIRYAALYLGTPPRQVPIAEDGTFGVRLDSAGPVAVEVRRLGYERAQGTVTVPTGSAVELVVALERRNMGFDGPSCVTR
jgi:hypothetical protein